MPHLECFNAQSDGPISMIAKIGIWQLFGQLYACVICEDVLNTGGKLRRHEHNNGI